MTGFLYFKAHDRHRSETGPRGELHVTFEVGTLSTRRYDLPKPHVRKIVVCNPPRNALLKEGSKSDRIDTRKLAELLYRNMLRSGYHGENGVRTLNEQSQPRRDLASTPIQLSSRSPLPGLRKHRIP